MKYNYRNSNGKFITKSKYESQLMRPMYTFIGMLVLATVIGIASSYAQSTRAQHTMSDEELCSLIAVECEGEKPVAVEVYEVAEVAPVITASDVAMWYTENDVELLDTVMNSGDIDALEDLLEERHAYARAVMIATE
jgi:hypothetical protein